MTIRTVCVGVAFLAAPMLAPAQSADFSGVHAFWRIAEQLRRNEEPADAAWDSLFATPGYAALHARERRRPALVTAFRAAFMPSRTAERDSILSTNNWASRVIRHVQPLPARRAALDAFMAKVQRNDMVGRALVQAATLLPPGTVNKFGRPPVAFIFFLPDGRGYPGLIVADLERTRTKVDPVPFFAHETTHFYYARIARDKGLNDWLVTDAGAAALRTLLTKLHEESIGDQFDKVDAIALTEVARAKKYGADSSWLSYLNDYRAEFDSAETRVRQLDAMLLAAAASPATLGAMSELLAKSLPLEGRPLGMYLTRGIRRALGDARIRATVGDPFTWLLAYAQAAERKRCDCTPLSRRSVTLLYSLRSTEHR
ncbi:MAG: DUF5700 domain-containing putative Zn-dependent protease [Gemmatimonadaceae bacterium]